MKSISYGFSRIVGRSRSRLYDPRSRGCLLPIFKTDADALAVKTVMNVVLLKLNNRGREESERMNAVGEYQRRSLVMQCTGVIEEEDSRR